MDILLSHGYFIAGDAHEQTIMKPYPPLGLLYVSSHLKAAGFSVGLYDSTFGDLAGFARYLGEKRPGLVGLYANLMTRQNVLRQIALCKQAGARVIVGGPEPASYAGNYLDAGADIVVRGEGELTLAELIPHLARHGLERLEEVRGIAFRSSAGQVLATPPREQIKDLSQQPWPDRQAIDLPRYLDTWKQHHGYSSASLITARGCPYTCKWCSHTVFGHTHRRRTVEDVADEVQALQETYHPDRLWYADDVFTIQPRWFLAYHQALKQRGLRLPFECISRADRLNREVVAALAEMGCYRLWIGSESGSQRILDAMSRRAEVADVQAKTKMLQEAGIQVGMFIMLGYSGEGMADIEATVAHLKKANPDLFLTTVAYPIKGTPFYEEVAQEILGQGEWARQTDRDLGVAGRYSPRFYDHATRWMVNEVAWHKARQAGSRDLMRLARYWLNARRGRLGMLLRQNEREEDSRRHGGRGWTAKERATDAW